MIRVASQTQNKSPRIDQGASGVGVVTRQDRGAGAIHRQRAAANDGESIGDGESTLLEEKQAVVGDRSGNRSGGIGDQCRGAGVDRTAVSNGIRVRGLGVETCSALYQ